MTPHKKKTQSVKKVKAWAVVNVELNEPCVFLQENTPKGQLPETAGAAIFVSDWEGAAKREAKEWKKKHLPHFKEIKVVECTITYKI